MNWPESLIDEIASRRAVLFIGAGVSMNSLGEDGATRPKSWSKFLNEGAAKLNTAPNKKLVKHLKRLISGNDFLTACEVIKNAMGREDFNAFMKAQFKDPGFKSADIHKILWGLDLRITITPNIDNIYDTFVAERSSGTVVVKSYADKDIAELIRGRERVLIKSHGSISSPDAIIFTRSEYAKARNENRAFYELLYALLSTHTFLFVGCGLEDPDIRSLLEDYRYRNPFSRKHYFTYPKEQSPKEVLDVYTESLNLGFINYSDAENHKALAIGLNDLKSQVDLRRPIMGDNQSW